MWKGLEKVTLGPRCIEKHFPAKENGKHWRWCEVGVVWRVWRNLCLSFTNKMKSPPQCLEAIRVNLRANQQVKADRHHNFRLLHFKKKKKKENLLRPSSDCCRVKLWTDGEILRNILILIHNSQQLSTFNYVYISALLHTLPTPANSLLTTLYITTYTTDSCYCSINYIYTIDSC